MNSRTYTLSSDTLAAGVDGIDIYESGKTNLTISLAGVTDYTSYHYTKFIVDFGDGSNQQIIQHLTDIWSLSSKSISHTFNPTNDYVTTYSVKISGYKTNLEHDIYTLNVNVGKSHVTDYKSLKIIDTQLYTTPDGKNNVMLTIEAQNPRFIGNIIVPYEDLDAILQSSISTLITPDVAVGIHLRTEEYSSVGGLQSIIHELYTAGTAGAYIIREQQLFVFVVGNEIVSQWSGMVDSSSESITVCEPAGAGFTMTDINGNTITPEFILVPEVSDDNTRYIHDPLDDWPDNLPYK